MAVLPSVVMNYFHLLKVLKYLLVVPSLRDFTRCVAMLSPSAKSLSVGLPAAFTSSLIAVRTPGPVVQNTNSSIDSGGSGALRLGALSTPLRAPSPFSGSPSYRSTICRSDRHIRLHVHK